MICFMLATLFDFCLSSSPCCVAERNIYFYLFYFLFTRTDLSVESGYLDLLLLDGFLLQPQLGLQLQDLLHPHLHLRLKFVSYKE